MSPVPRRHQSTRGGTGGCYKAARRTHVSITFPSALPLFSFIVTTFPFFFTTSTLFSISLSYYFFFNHHFTCLLPVLSFLPLFFFSSPIPHFHCVALTFFSLSFFPFHLPSLLFTLFPLISFPLPSLNFFFPQFRSLPIPSHYLCLHLPVYFIFSTFLQIDSAAFLLTFSFHSFHLLPFLSLCPPSVVFPSQRRTFY